MTKRLLALTLVIVLCLAFAACGSSEPTAPADTTGTTDTTVPEVTREAVSTQTVEFMENNTITLTRYDDDYVTAEVNFTDFGPKDSTGLVLSTIIWISNYYSDFEVYGTFSKEDFRYVYHDGTVDTTQREPHPEWYDFGSMDDFIDYAAIWYAGDIELIKSAVEAL